MNIVPVDLVLSENLIMLFFPKVYSRQSPQSSSCNLIFSMTRGSLKIDTVSMGKTRILDCLPPIPLLDPVRAHYESATKWPTRSPPSICLASMGGLVSVNHDKIIQCLYDKRYGDALILSKWFAIHAAVDCPHILDKSQYLYHAISSTRHRRSKYKHENPDGTGRRKTYRWTNPSGSPPSIAIERLVLGNPGPKLFAVEFRVFGTRVLEHLQPRR